MNDIRRLWHSALAIVVCASYSLSLESASQAQQPAAKPRILAPGVETTIEPDVQPEETVSTHDVVEVVSDESLRHDPIFSPQVATLYGKARQAKFRRTTWCLQFSFKPLRMIEVDLPQPDGTTQRQLVWYLVYRVTNTGEHLASQRLADGTYAAQPATTEEIRFVPSFLLEGHDIGVSGRRTYKAYRDQVLPAAVAAIEARERTGRELLTTEQMSRVAIPVSNDETDYSVYGVVTWVDVDPRLDYFSIFVGGLTNAYRWSDPPGAYQVGDEPGKHRQYSWKTLQLNFWRPGDEFLQHEAEIRFGVPPGKAHLYNVAEGVSHQWIYR